MEDFEQEVNMIQFCWICPGLGGEVGGGGGRLVY